MSQYIYKQKSIWHLRCLSCHYYFYVSVYNDTLVPPHILYGWTVFICAGRWQRKAMNRMCVYGLESK